MQNIQIGNNFFRNKLTPIFFAETDRLRHLYVLGKTGVGKSTLFQNLCLQDIQQGHGVCYIDPHGESIEWLLSRIPKNRLEDVILFDPSDKENPMGLNLLEATETDKDFVVSEVIQIFYKLFDPEGSGIIGPQFEHWLRNSALTVMAGPNGGSLIEIPKLFVDKRFEIEKRQFVTDPIIQEFWGKQMASTSEFHKSEMLNYFSSKFGHFMNNELMRNIIGQHKSSFNFDQIIADEKIFLINLSKGKIGELNAQMLGLILVSKLQTAILKRADIEEKQRTPFYLYIDEFQNFITKTFESMLSESRKYGLSLNITNQYFAQLPEATQKAILGNIGSLACFGLGNEDAKSLEDEFKPFSSEDLMNLERFHFYLKLMINGKTSEAFSVISLPPLGSADPKTGQQITSLNQLDFGRPKLLVTEEIKQYLR